jgi:pimeloyl-ACP methyl ester carboxylesterase
VPRPALARQVAVCAVPRLGQRVLNRQRARFAPEEQVQRTLAWTTADVSTVSEGMRRLAVELAAVRAADDDCAAAYLEAARSVGLLVARAAAYRATIASITAPGLVLQGALDRLVPPAGVRQLRALQPDWDVHLLPEVGHVPQIEAPDRTAELVLAWLAGRPLDGRALADEGAASAGDDSVLAGAS